MLPHLEIGPWVVSSYRLLAAWALLLLLLSLLLFLGCDDPRIPSVRGLMCTLIRGDRPTGQTLDASHLRAKVNADDDSVMMVAVDVAMAGVFRRASSGSTGLLGLLQHDGVQTLPPYLDEMAEKGYVALRVPHAPPAYAESSLVPGIPPSTTAVEFSYYLPPDETTRTTVPVTVTLDAAWPGGYPVCLLITAIHTPTIAASDKTRETLKIEATAVDDPEVRAEAVSFALAPGYDLNEGVGAAFGLYLPVVMKQSP